MIRFESDTVEYKRQWGDNCLKAVQIVKNPVNLNERQLKAIEHVKIKGKITNGEYQKLVNISKPMATIELRKLDELGFFNKVGKTGKGIYYIIR